MNRKILVDNKPQKTVSDVDESNCEVVKKVNRSPFSFLSSKLAPLVNGILTLSPFQTCARVRLSTALALEYKIGN
jgi:hypothetical protein